MGTETTRPARERITAFALETLEDALAQAKYGPVQRQHGHRLALAWLCHAGLLLDWQCREFWKVMADPLRWLPSESYISGYRRQRMQAMLDRCYYGLGLELPSHGARARLARRYGSSQRTTEASPCATPINDATE